MADAAEASTTIDPKLIKKASDEVSRAVVALVRQEPFFGHLLSGVNRDISSRTPTAGVSNRAGRPLLSVNPEFFMKTITRKDERVAIIKHEVLHLLFDHVGRMDWHRMNPHVFNLAADVVVNQFIGKKWPLPTDAVTLNSFDFYLPADQTVDWYYEELMRHASSSSGEGGLGEHGFGCDHEGWEPNFDSETDRTIARHELARLVRDARDRSGKEYGAIPGPIADLVQALIDELEPTIDWRRVLRMFTNSSRRTRIANTLRRPSKRYGTYPGIKVNRFHRLAVVIDTSWSVDDELLGEFFAEVHGMWRQGSEITVIEADAAVQNVWEYAGDGPPQVVAGRGGTAFDPALQWVADAQHPYDAAIYLTDGYAPSPAVRPRCKMLWVLPENGSDEALEGHRVVRIINV